MYKIHVPVEEYGFVEGEFETQEEAFLAYEEVKILWANHKEGLNQTEWARFRDSYIMGDGTMNPDMQEQLERCNKWQKLVINQIKLAIKNNK